MFVSWRAATERALYAPDGFYRRPALPAAHFRTSVHGSDRFAEAIAVLLGRIDLVRLTVVDVGSGGGELLSGLSRLVSSAVRLVGVDLRPRPDGLPERVEWRCTMPDSVSGLVIANEWLDNVPVDVVELAEDGPRTVLVEPSTGEERLGPGVGSAEVAWLREWWPLRSIGDRAEVGRPRDAAWGEVVSRLRQGVAVAVDYGHLRTDRPVDGTLAGYRSGRPVRPIPDGSCDVCAHVAVDAVRVSGEEVAGQAATLLRQRDALRALGVEGVRPPASKATEDPAGYLRSLARAGGEGELLDPGGLGEFFWLVQPVGGCFPALEYGKI
jgi:SAM-dependent MidA family methyltransferase